MTPLARLQDLILPVGMIASVLVIMVPLPSSLMDLLLSCNIAIAVIMLLTTIYVRTPLEFSIFPSLLLATTLFRLVLNVATTRLILTKAGSDGLLAAGGVVKTFGEFVTGGAAGNGKIVVGMIIFAIIVMIQFVVITKGATRISEVAARFALDGMPGRQMAIDADLNAGIIDEREAQRRRREVTQQADFFGAMDGASKFVRGDAIAGIIITLNQHRRRAVHRRDRSRHEPRSGRLDLHHADDRRRPGHAGAGLPDFLGRRLAGHAQQLRNRSAGRVPQAAFFASAGAGRGRRLPRHLDLHQPAADSAACSSAASCMGLATTLSRRKTRAKASADAKQQAEADQARRNSASRTIWPSIPWRSRSAWA